MKSQDGSHTPQSLVIKCKAIVVELTATRKEWLSFQQQPINQLMLSEAQKQQHAVMLKAMDKVILDVASYIDEHDA